MFLMECMLSIVVSFTKFIFSIHSAHDPFQSLILCPFLKQINIKCMIQYLKLMKFGQYKLGLDISLGRLKADVK